MATIITTGNASVHQVSCRQSGRTDGVVSVNCDAMKWLGEDINLDYPDDWQYETECSRFFGLPTRLMRDADGYQRLEQPNSGK